ncbi:MAG: ABC transporter permease [Actinomycetes bacterium]
MFRATLRSLLARKLRLVLSAIAIILGVGFVAGSFILTDTIGQVFDNIFAQANKKVAVVIRGKETAVSSDRNPVPAQLLTTVRALPGVAGAEPQIGGYAQLLDKKGKTYPYHNGPPAIGFAFDPNRAVSEDNLVTGNAPQGPDEIVVDDKTARMTHYHVGDTAPVLTRLARKNYRIVGIYKEGSTGNQGGASLIAFDVPTAQRVLGRPGEYDAIVIAAQPNTSGSQLLREVSAVLPSTTEVVTGSQQAKDSANDIKQGLKFFQTFLLVFGGVALFVGAFIIFNTFSMLIGQRIRELALLRAVGASRGQVIRSVLVEAVVIGAIGTTLGLALGVGFAVGLPALVRAIGGGAIPHGSLVFAPRTFIAAYAVGVGITALAALVPAVRASRIPPVAALRDAVLPTASLARAAVIGGIMTVLGVVLLVPGLRGNFGLLGLGAVLVFLGVTVLSPLIARPVVRVVSAPFMRGVPGRLGRRNATRNPRRTSTTAGALMIGIALISAASVLGASVKTSIHHVINAAFAADFDVGSKSFDNGLTPSIAGQLRAKPEIGAVDELGFAPALVDGHKAGQVTALPGSAVDRTVAVKRVAGTITLGPGQILLDQTTAEKYHWHAGQSLTVQYERGGAHALTLTGIYADNQLAGSYLVDQSERVNFPSRLDGVILIKGAPGVPLTSVRKAIDSVTAAYPSAQVQTRDEFIGDTVGFINGFLAFITGLLIFSVAIAVIGIVNTLVLSVIERTRELGLLRAVGLSRRQMRNMIRVESIVVAVYGAVLGLAVGSALGVAIVKALHKQGVDSLSFPVGRLVVLVIVAAVFGLIAAIWPARRAARLDVLQAIATE